MRLAGLQLWLSALGIRWLTRFGLRIKLLEVKSYSDRRRVRRVMRKP